MPLLDVVCTRAMQQLGQCIVMCGWIQRTVDGFYMKLGQIHHRLPLIYYFRLKRIAKDECKQIKGKTYNPNVRVYNYNIVWVFERELRGHIMVQEGVDGQEVKCLSLFMWGGWVISQVSTQTFFQETLISKYSFEKLRIGLLYFEYLKLPFTKLCRKKVFQELQRGKIVVPRFFLTRRPKCQNFSKAMSCGYDKV